jgi:hypothetical protein
MRCARVGKALLLAKVEIETADELPAEHHVQHEQRVKIGRGSTHRRMTEAQLRLRGARRGTMATPRPPFTGTLFGSAAIVDAIARRQSPNARRASGAWRAGSRVAGGDQGGAR